MADVSQHKIKEFLEASAYLSSISRLRDHSKTHSFSGLPTRALSEKEIGKLQLQGNRCDNWQKILVSVDFSPQFIFDTTFSGTNILCSQNGQPTFIDNGYSHASGIYRSTVTDSLIGQNCCVHSSGICKGILDNGAVVWNTKMLLCQGPTSFGNGSLIRIGSETGGRDIPVFAEMSLDQAISLTTDPKNSSVRDALIASAKSYAEKSQFDFCYIGTRAIVRNATKVIDTYVGDFCVIDGATLVQNTTLLGTEKEPAIVSHGAIVSDSLLQWGSCVTQLAIVRNSLLLEHSEVERHANVTQSIIGPNTSVAEGEVTSTLLGPFVGFHHQALCIGTLWPQGKGNIGYGANVGSNHTGKAPDQELHCGTGIFFGLGTNIKFPANFSDAAYSIIATSVTTLPQKCVFPFSLINTPASIHAEIPPAINEIFPAWVLYDCLYSVKRNESKFAKRNKATRNAIESVVFTPLVIDAMVRAHALLSAASNPKELYTEVDIAGLGKNYLTDKSRLKAIGSYEFHLKNYCLDTLKKQLAKSASSAKDMYTLSVPLDVQWEHARLLMIARGYTNKSISENLSDLKIIQDEVYKAVLMSKQKDEFRGVRIIPDYLETHIPAASDPFIMDCKANTEAYKQEIDRILAGLS